METILVPTDFSPAANNALNYAIGLANFFNARIILVNAYPVPYTNYEMGFSAEMVSLFQKSSQEKLAELKTEIGRKEGRSLSIDCVSEMGSPFEVIKSVCATYDPDLIVIGIVGEAGDIKEHIIGSTAVRVARHLDIPSFIIPEKTEFRRIRKISFACDMDRTEETDLVYVAKYFSQAFDAELEVIYVRKTEEEELSYEKARTMMFIERKLENVRHRTIEITGNSAGNELETYFKDHKTDLIMLSPKKHNVFFYLLNSSVTRELAFHAHLPILAIH